MGLLRTWGPWFLLLLILSVLAILIAGKTAGPSLLSSGPDGWLAAGKYLEARGVEITVLDRPVSEDPGTEVLVSAFPWQQSALLPSMDPLRDFVREGGTLFLGYSGDPEATKESQLLNLLDAPLERVGPAIPMAPVAWWKHRNREWTLAPSGRNPELPPGRISALPAVPRPPREARKLLEVEEEPGLFALVEFPFGQGRVVLFPSELISNGRLDESGNVAALESLLALAPGSRWAFDEFAHGLQPARGDQTLQAPQAAFDLFLGHIALLYLLALAAVARRFGPPWRNPPIQAGSAAAFLRGLGTLHHKYGHHSRAAELLLERARALAPRRRIPENLASLASNADARDFLRLARGLARSSSGSSPKHSSASISKAPQGNASTAQDAKG